MILWLVLFVLVVAISFVLAVKSMQDFRQVFGQTHQDFGLFLIRQSQGLNKQLMTLLHDDLLHSGSAISFERLFKGNQSALVVFGPRKLISKYQDSLNLLELEDYTNVRTEQLSAWEIGIKTEGQFIGRQQSIFSHLPQLEDIEQFWWQVIVTKSFHPQIRAVLVSFDSTRRKNLTHLLQNLPMAGLFKLPKAFSNAQIIDFYNKRSFQKDNQNPNLELEQVFQLISI